MREPFVQIQNLDEHRQVQVYTAPDNRVAIVGYALDETDGELTSHAGMYLSPDAAQAILNMLKEWEQYAFDQQILQEE